MYPIPLRRVQLLFVNNPSVLVLGSGILDM